MTGRPPSSPLSPPRGSPDQASRDGAAQRTGAREPAAEAAPRAVRESGLSLPQMRARDPLLLHDLPVLEVARELPATPLPGPGNAPAQVEPAADPAAAAADGDAAAVIAAARAAEVAAG